MFCAQFPLTITREGSTSGVSSGRQFQNVDENHQEIIYNGNRTVFYLRQAKDYSPKASLSDYSEELLWRSRAFSTALYLVRTKNIKQDLETTKMSINRGVGKEDVIYIYKVYVHTQWNITQP